MSRPDNDRDGLSMAITVILILALASMMPGKESPLPTWLRVLVVATFGSIAGLGVAHILITLFHG